ncbi:hypothetical protein [Herpetosiphon geysericola]|uniref:Uncharacterized protein n=1 Tax=Herpetosiphon geysericola TaxID=70996 RepID=A0A0N8GPA1_9CHLR|nr:hypothetical protein [Herpetosiphon geysericola]KPL80322.1 hypothetical protein SE18_25095 [Herpetosiphon geysericola]
MTLLNNALVASIEPDEYDPWLSLHYQTPQQQIMLYRGSIYHTGLFDDDQTECCLDFNFGHSDLIRPYRLRRFAEWLIFVPMIDNAPELDNVWAYHAQFGQGLLIPQHNWDAVWQAAGFAVRSVTSIPIATSADLQLLWLLTSQFKQASLAMTRLKTYIKALQQAILAEEPNHQPSIKQLLQAMLDQQLLLEPIPTPRLAAGLPITAYWIDHQQQIQEWPALIVQQQQPYLLLFGTLVKILEA